MLSTIHHRPHTAHKRNGPRAALFVLFSLVLCVIYVQYRPSCDVTTVITSAPCRAMSRSNITLVAEVVQSLTLAPGLLQCPLVIAFDGNVIDDSNASKLHKKCSTPFPDDVYQRYKMRAKEEIRKFVATQGGAAPTFVEIPKRSCLTTVLHNVLDGFVKTKYVHVMLHDLPLRKYLPWRRVLAAMQGGPKRADSVRYVLGLNSDHVRRTSMRCQKNWSKAPHDSMQVDGLTFTRSNQYSDNNHFASVEYYTTRVWPRALEYNFMSHYTLYCAPLNAWAENGDDWGMWYVGDVDDGDFLRHTDGRKLEQQR